MEATEKVTKAAQIGAAVAAISQAGSIVYSVKNKTGFWLGLGYFALAGIAGYSIGWGVTQILTKEK